MPNHGPINFAKLIPELSSWNDEAGISPEDWARCVGTRAVVLIGESR